MAFWKGGRTLHHHGPMTRDEFKKLPRHVAIIMDGNGRWAKKHKLAVAKGHRQGVETLREIIRHTDDLKIEALSLYAFSTENWNRSPEEVGALMGLSLEFFASEIDELDAKNVRILILGDKSRLPQKQREALRGGGAHRKEHRAPPEYRHQLRRPGRADAGREGDRTAGAARRDAA